MYNTHICAHTYTFASLQAPPALAISDLHGLEAFPVLRGVVVRPHRDVPVGAVDTLQVPRGAAGDLAGETGRGVVLFRCRLLALKNERIKI